MKRGYTRVYVTDGDIRDGVRSDCYQCPVGLALTRATGLMWHVWRDDAILEGESPTPRIQFGKRTREIIRRLDRGETVEPFTFRIASKWRKP